MQKHKLEIRLITIMLSVFYVIFWAALYFVGYFFAANLLFYLIAVILTILTYLFVKKISKRLAIILVVITILVTAFTFYSGFEEDYCVQKGIQAEKTGPRFIKANKENAKALKGFNVKEGSEIGVNFKAHMLCHTTFNLKYTLFEQYFFIE